MKLGTSKTVQLRVILILLLSGLFCVLLLLPLSTIAEPNATDSETASATLTSGGDKDYMLSALGKTLEYGFTLRKNQGERPETYHIEVEAETQGSIKLSESGDSSVTLSKDDSTEIRVEIILPDIEIDGYYRFFFNVTSTNMPPVSEIIFALVSPEGVILTDSLRPVLVITPSAEYIGIVTHNEPLEVDIEVTCYVESTKVYLTHEILEVDNDKIKPKKDLDISVSEAQNFDKGETKKFKLTIQFAEKLQNSIKSTIHIQIEAKSTSGSEITKPVTLRFVAHYDPPETTILDTVIGSPIAMVGITTVITVSILCAAVGGTEVGKYKFLLILFIPLYTKLHKDKILDHFTRGRVYEYIRNHPGVHYSEIKRELDLNNGSLTYHLHTLEREALVKSQNIGRYKLFYPTGVKIPKDMEPQLSTVRNQILDIIKDHPGITQKEIGLSLDNKSARTISYHVKNMTREGIIRVEKDGRENKCYINDEVLEAGQVRFIETKDIDDPGGSDAKYIESDSIFRQI